MLNRIGKTSLRRAKITSRSIVLQDMLNTNKPCLTSSEEEPQFKKMVEVSVRELTGRLIKCTSYNFSMRVKNRL